MSHFTAGFDRLKRLFHNVQGVNWQDKVQQLSKSSENANLTEIRTIVKGLCEEIAQHARALNDAHTRKMLFQFLTCIGHSSVEIGKRLSEVQLMQNNAQKHQALIQLLLSEEVQHILTEQLKLYFNNPVSQSHMGDASKKHHLDRVLEQGMAHLMDYISVASNQDSYTPEGRIMKSIIDLIAMFIDVCRVNLGYPPAFASDSKNESGRQPQPIMPMPMPMKI